jgi:hypothetical protein
MLTQRVDDERHLLDANYQVAKSGDNNQRRLMIIKNKSTNQQQKQIRCMKTKLLTFESNERQQSQDGTELK